MGKFLDAQVSQNSGSFGAPLVAATTTPTLFGTLGLVTSGAGTNLRVKFDVTMTISSVLVALSSVTIQVFRGVGGPGVATLVYTGINSLDVLGVGVLSTRTFTFTGSDFNPPNPIGALTYQAFVSVSALGVIIVRSGPESFNAIAVSD